MYGNILVSQSSRRNACHMNANPKVIELIYDSIDEHNEIANTSKILAKSLDTVLFGRDGNLDSLGLVSLIVAVEERVKDEFGADISVADDRAMSQTQSPFRTVGTLADYVSELVKEAGYV